MIEAPSVLKAAAHYFGLLVMTVQTAVADS